MKKKCPKCDVVYEDAENHFHKDSLRSDGLDYRCVYCKRKTDNISSRKFRDKNRYERDKKKIKARTVARDTYGKLKLGCAVINCDKWAEELHHVSYDKPLDVVPLCKKHHYGLHSFEK